MHKKLTVTFLITAVSLLQGCAAPGDSIGSLKVQGSLVSNSDQPVANKDIEFLLPAAYGLVGLDVVMNNPEDFGHKGTVFRVTTDQEGKFQADLGPRIYPVIVWLLPPLGGFPERPPAPFILARFPDNRKEYYAIQTDDGKYKTYDYSGSEVPFSESKLQSIHAFNKGNTDPKSRETIGVVELKLK